MKELLILRHAKAANDSESGRDFDRPLNEQGREAADFLGKYLQAHHELPDLVCCSDALRTRETFLRIMDKLPRPLPVSYQNGLYLSSAGDLLDYVNAIPEAAERVLLIGHNPGMHHLARILSGSGDAEALTALEYKFPTGGMAIIQFPPDSKWQSIGPNSGKLTAFLRPKLLMKSV